MKRLHPFFKKLIIFLFWLLVWQLLALKVGKTLLLPSPIEVLPRLWQLMGKSDFWITTVLSLCSVFAGVVLSIIAGTVLAVITSSVKLLDELISPLLGVIRSAPIASFIVLAILWLGRDLVPSLIAALIVLPIVWANVSAGIKNTDKQLLEMAKCYRFPFLRTVRRIYIPSIMPHFLAAVRTALGLGWKAGITAEVLTVPPNSIGKMLSDARMYMETVDLFAWTFVIIVCSIIIEKLIMSAIASLGRNYTIGGEGK